jgi:Protein of unknown function (DUF998)
MQQFLLLCGIILGPLFIVVFLIEGALRKGYYPMRQPVSALAIGPRGWIQRANFFIAAALTLSYAFGLHFALHGTLGSIVLPILVGIIGLGLAGAGIFVTDVTGLPQNNHKLAKRTRDGVLHDLASLPVFGFLFLAFFIYGYLSTETGHWGFAIYSVLSALVFAPSFVLAGAGFSGASKFASAGGLFQRIAICVGFLWLSIVAAALIGGFWGQGQLLSTMQLASASLRTDLKNVTPYFVDASEANGQLLTPQDPQEQKIKDDVVALLLAGQPGNADFYSQLWLDAVGKRYVLVTQPIAESSFDEIIDSQTGTVTPISESARYDLSPVGRKSMLYIDSQHIYLYTLDQATTTLVSGSALSGTETYTSGIADNPAIIPSGMSYTPDSITVTIYDSSKRVPNPKLGEGATMNGVVREVTFSF